MNAGSVVNAAASVTQTNGSWDITADTFIATGGTPFSAVQVGEWVSIYNDGVTSGAVYVAQVVTVNSLGLSITLSTTAKYGTKPAAGATGKSCKVGGSWLSELPLTTITGTVPASTKVNIKGNLTITAGRTIALAGATTTPLWFSGYSTTPGDLDADTTNSLTKPVWTFNSTFGLTTSGAHQIWSSLSVTGSRSGPLWIASGTFQRLLRCRCDNTSSNAAAVAIRVDAATPWIGYSYFKCPATATTNGVVQSNANGQFHIGCVADGGGLAGFQASTSNIYIGCVAINTTGAGFLATTGAITILFCTVYGATADGVKWTGTPGASQVIGCVFSGLNSSTATTNGINNASGTNTAQVTRACNDFYNVTNTEVGFGDSPAFFGQTDSSPVATSGTNMTAVVGSNARRNGFPGIFENQTYSGFPDIGAVSHADTKLLAHLGLSGGVHD